LQKKSAFENMAIDEAVFRESQRLKAPPTLRFFGWLPPAVSLGFFQDVSEGADVDACRARQIDIVRRLTGGKAVFHDSELTYSLVARQDHPLFPGGILGTYLAISNCIAAGLSRLGIETQLEALCRRPAGGLQSFCFSASSRYELNARGRKICGSAQLRSNGSFLQHGAVLLDFDPSLTFTVITKNKRNARQQIELLRESVTSVKGETGEEPDVELLCGYLLESFEKKLRIRLVSGELTAEEESLKERLVEEKYQADSWNRCAIKKPT
jgi:lipoate-protein ligase A